MQVKVQVVTITDEGQEITQDIACVERQELTPVTLGLSLAEGKAVLQVLQEVVVEWQLVAYLRQQRVCPQCGKTRRRKGLHHTVVRRVAAKACITRCFAPSLECSRSRVPDSIAVRVRPRRRRRSVPWRRCFPNGPPRNCCSWKPNGRPWSPMA
jgi:hypothetical protein